MYHFLSGYTAKVAGTEKGVTEPKATFSTCFGAPFLPLRAEPLRARCSASGSRSIAGRVWLVNTGWTGGPYGVGTRMKIALHASDDPRRAVRRDSTRSPTSATTIFNLDIPTSCPGDRRPRCSGRAIPGRTARTTISRPPSSRAMFVENFKAFEEASAPRCSPRGPTSSWSIGQLVSW